MKSSSGSRKKSESWWTKKSEESKHGTEWCAEAVSVEAFEIFSQGEIWRVLEKPEDLSDCEPETRVDAPVVPDVTDVPVSPSSVVTEFCDGFSCCSDWDLVLLSSKSVLTLVQSRRKR